MITLEELSSAMELVEEANDILQRAKIRSESTMTDAERNGIKACVEKEGFWYCFESYSAFDHGRNAVADRKFHELRLAFLKAGHDLINYIGLGE